MTHVLELQGYGVRTATRIILHEVDLSIPEVGVFALMGPGGAGKSTLLRSLTDLVEHPAFDRRGIATYRGEPVSEANRPVLVRQRLTSAAQSMWEVCADGLPNRGELTQAEQREVLASEMNSLGCSSLMSGLDTPMCNLPSATQRQARIFAATLSNPGLILVDEATAELDEASANEVLELLELISIERAVLFVTHNQGHARKVANHAGLLAASRLIEAGRAEEFFEEPTCEPTRVYLRTGGCSLPSPNASEDDLDESFRVAKPQPEPTQQPPGRHDAEPNDGEERAVSNAVGPRGFHWLKPGRLGGTPYPGIVASAQQDLEALCRVGATHLITLTEEPAKFEDQARSLGLEVRFFPIVDMEAPEFSDAASMCREVAELTGDGAVVVFHCKAGLGRTGTMLAAQLVFEGQDAASALSDVREAHAKWVQSDVQERFLDDFARFVRSGRRNDEQPSQGAEHVPR